MIPDYYAFLILFFRDSLKILIPKFPLCVTLCPDRDTLCSFLVVEINIKPEFLGFNLTFQTIRILKLFKTRY